MIKFRPQTECDTAFFEERVHDSGKCWKTKLKEFQLGELMALMHTPEDRGPWRSHAPTFRLPGHRWQKHTVADDLKGAKAALVMFICNHCPYVIAVEDRLIELGSRIRMANPVKILAISANDATTLSGRLFRQDEGTKARRKRLSLPLPATMNRRPSRAYRLMRRLHARFFLSTMST